MNKIPNHFKNQTPKSSNNNNGDGADEWKRGTKVTVGNSNVVMTNQKSGDSNLKEKDKVPSKDDGEWMMAPERKSGRKSNQQRKGGRGGSFSAIPASRLYSNTNGQSNDSFTFTKGN